MNNNCGFFNRYRYWCEAENCFITEERREGDTPKVCKNNINHKIRDSINNYVEGKYVNIHQTQAISNFENCDMYNINTNNMIEKVELLSQRVKVLELLLQREGKIKFV